MSCAGLLSQPILRGLARDKNAKVLALSSHEDPSYVRFMLKAGALGYLSKRSAPEELIQAIQLLCPESLNSGIESVDKSIGANITCTLIIRRHNFLSQRNYSTSKI